MPSTGQGRQDRGRAHWKIPLVLLGLVMAAAVVLTLVSRSIAGLTAAPEEPAAAGEPVMAGFSVGETWGDVSFPPEVSIPDFQLTLVGGMEVPAQAAWLEDRGGIITGSRRLDLTLKGNRPHPVQVVEVRDASECTPVQRGTLMRLLPDTNINWLSVDMGISVGDSGSRAWTTDTSGNRRPFFPDNRFTLAPGEEKPLVVDLLPVTDGEVCHARLELTVLDAGREHRQTIPGNGWLVPVLKPEPEASEESYAAVYLGGRVCPQYVTATTGWRSGFPQNFEEVCGPGGG